MEKLCMIAWFEISEFMGIYSIAHKIFRMLTTFRICLHSNAVSNTTNLDKAIRKKIHYPGLPKYAGMQCHLVVTCGKLPGE